MQQSLIDILKVNFSGQFFARIFNFLITVYLIRHVDGEILGLINVRLFLLYVTITFLYTEPLRKCCWGADMSVRDAVQYAWLAPVFALAIGVVVSYIWSHLSTMGVVEYGEYTFLIVIFFLSAVIESLAEPLLIITVRSQNHGLHALMQSILLVSNKVVVVVLIMLNFESKTALWVGQIAAAIIYTTTYYVQFCRLTETLNFYPWFSGFSEFDGKHFQLIGTVLLHSVQKQLITDGSGYVMTFTQKLNFTEQAVYDAIERLGSLVARLVFRPLEESCSIYFSAQLSRSSHIVVPQKALDMLMSLCRVLVSFGLVVFVFSIPYSPLAVRIYGGSLLADNMGATLLSLYAAYLVVMGLNGTLECFAFALMDTSGILSHGRFILVSAIVHLVLCVALLEIFGAAGFIIANIINSAARSVFNWRHIQSRRNARGVDASEMLPDPTLCLLLVVAFAMTGLSALLFGTTPGIIFQGAHVAVGGVMLLFVAFNIHQSGLIQHLLTLERKTN